MSEDDFYSLVENSNHKELKLYVYNVDSDMCREVCVFCEPICMQDCVCANVHYFARAHAHTHTHIHTLTHFHTYIHSYIHSHSA